MIALSPGIETLYITGTMSNVDSGGGLLNFIYASLDNFTNTLINFGNQEGFTTSSFHVAGISGYSFILTTTNLSAYIANTDDITLSTNKEINTSFTSASLTVATNGILSGTGVYTGNLTNNGLLVPGYPTGRLIVNGNVTLNTLGTLQINVASPTDYGNLQVDGSVDLAGTLEVAPLGSTPLTYGEKLTFINSTGPIKGTFKTIQIDQNYCRGRVTILGDPQATVTIAPTSYTYVAQNQNQTNVALARIFHTDSAAACEHLMDTASASNCSSGSMKHTAVVAIHHLPCLNQDSRRLATNQYEICGLALNSFIPATSGDALVVSTDLDSLSADQYPGAFNAIMPTLYQSLSTIAFNIDNAQNQEMIQRFWGIRLANASEQGGHFSMSGLVKISSGVSDISFKSFL